VLQFENVTIGTMCGRQGMTENATNQNQKLNIDEMTFSKYRELAPDSSGQSSQNRNVGFFLQQLIPKR
jgi:hypothetical protein